MRRIKASDVGYAAVVFPTWLLVFASGLGWVALIPLVAASLIGRWLAYKEESNDDVLIRTTTLNIVTGIAARGLLLAGRWM